MVERGVLPVLGRVSGARPAQRVWVRALELISGAPLAQQA
jgi:hypothetical protein